MSICVHPDISVEIRAPIDASPDQIPELLAKWENVVGFKTAEWGVKRMRTKCRVCNIEALCIWLNLELAKKPVHWLEYIIVHELDHLHVRNHNDKFILLLDQFMPKRRMYQDEMNWLTVWYGE
ncbi:MAG: M48 family metallopeptidase [Saprospiraceae bacterium]|nr:M48 family metallopeptidase [Saprospiraceae bacterium]